MPRRATMNAPTTTNRARKSFLTRKLVAIVAIGVMVYVWRFRYVNALFNDTNYVAMRADLHRTLALPDGSPEQAVAYMCLGKHLQTPVYGNVTGFDACHWIRDPHNPLRPLFRVHPQLEHDWDFKCGDGFSNAD